MRTNFKAMYTCHTIRLALTFVPVAVTAQKKPAPAVVCNRCWRQWSRPGGILARGSTAAAVPKTRLALSAFQKSASLQASGVGTKRRSVRASAVSRCELTIRAGCCGPFIAQCRRHDGQRKTSGAVVHDGTRSALREISCEPDADANGSIRERRGPQASRSTVPAWSHSSCRRRASNPRGAIEILISGATKSLVVRDAGGKIRCTRRSP